MASEQVLRAIVHREPEGGYWAEVPELPGCYTQGETLDETLLNLHEAVGCWLEAAATVSTAVESCRIGVLELAA